MSKTRRKAPRVGRTPDLLRKSHVHPRRLVEPEIDLTELDDDIAEANAAEQERIFAELELEDYEAYMFASLEDLDYE